MDRCAKTENGKDDSTHLRVGNHCRFEIIPDKIQILLDSARQVSQPFLAPNVNWVLESGWPCQVISVI